MTFSMAHARILADKLSDNQREILKLHAGKSQKAEMSDIPFETVNELFDLDLLRRATNMLDGKEIVLLTEKGKKVAKLL